MTLTLTITCYHSNHRLPISFDSAQSTADQSRPIDWSIRDAFKPFMHVIRTFSISKTTFYSYRFVETFERTFLFSLWHCYVGGKLKCFIIKLKMVIDRGSLLSSSNVIGWLLRYLLTNFIFQHSFKTKEFPIAPHWSIDSSFFITRLLTKVRFPVLDLFKFRRQTFTS